MPLGEKEIRWFTLFSLLFLGVSAGLILLRLSALIFLIPFLLALFYLAFFSFDWFFLCTIALIPLSIPLRFLVPGLGFDLALPAEPMLIILLLLLIMKSIRGGMFPAAFIRQPLTLAILAYLSWTLVTAVTSTLPVVSIKYFLSQLWFITTAYFLGFLLFRDRKNIFRFILAYVFPLVAVAFYTFYHQAQTGFFNQKAAHSAMFPFYNDHTAYGAVLSLFLPVVAGLAFFHEKYGQKTRWIFSGIVVFLFAALVFSYSRAAWISFAAMLILFLLIRFRIRIQLIFGAIVLAVALLIIFQQTLLIKMGENRQESSGSMAKHLESVTNIRSDASNLERILRWKCALAMFAEKPFTGWGPGTYMFQYAPFQHSYDRTIISTDFGDRGNAHSEYLRPLSESGWPGLLLFLLILILAVYKGIHTYFTAGNREDRLLSLTVTLGLFTFIIHGMLNNFLDTAKAAIPFWGFIAVLAALSYKPSSTPEEPTGSD